MGIRVITAGPRTTVQDMGRPGYQNSGFSPSGVMDRIAMRRANLLANNPDEEAVLEFCLMGPMLLFEEEANLVLSGGDFSAVVADRRYQAEEVFHVNGGETVMISTGSVGLFGCLAVGGGLDIPEIMGSRSTNVKCGIGGYEGRALQAGDVLKMKHPRYGAQNISWRKLPPRNLPDGKEIFPIRVIPGPQEDAFTSEGRKTFYESVYEITNQSDRMGFRLTGPQVETVAGSDIISDGIVSGSIQIPGNGEPIVMMADRQTTGGYAKIATVASADLPDLAQMRPGQKVRFVEISVQEAQRLYREEHERWKPLRRGMIGPLFEPREG